MPNLATRIGSLFAAPVAALNTDLGEPGTDARNLSRLEDDRRRLQYLHLLSGLWLAFGAVSLLSVPFYVHWQIAVAASIGSAVTFVASRTLLKRRRVFAAGTVFCICVDLTFLTMFLLLCSLVGAEEAFRTQTPVLMLMGMTALFAGALIAPRAAFIFAAVNMVLIIAVRLWLAPDAVPRPSTVVFGWLLAGISFLYERTLRDVFAQLREIRMGLETVVLDRTAELRDSVTRLQSTTQELTIANRDLEFFCASVAHDLRGPLIAIEGYSRLLQEDGVARDNPRAAALVDRMLQVESRMSRLIDGLLSFAHLGHHELKRQAVDMTALAQRVVGELRDSEGGRDLQIEVESLPEAIADPVLIEQVLVNLLTNAIKFTRPRERAEIRIFGWIEGGESIYAVRDNGVGFAMRDAARLFNALQRLHPQEQFEGTGIGLTAIQRIISRHGGRVWARGEVEMGAEFFFALPRIVNYTNTVESESSLRSGVG